MLSASKETENVSTFNTPNKLPIETYTSEYYSDSLRETNAYTSRVKTLSDDGSRKCSFSQPITFYSQVSIPINIQIKNEWFNLY